MYGDDRDHRIGQTQVSSEAILGMTIFVVVTLAVDWSVSGLFGLSPVSVGMMFGSMVIGAVVTAAVLSLSHKRRTDAVGARNRRLEAEREAEKQKQIDAMLRGNSKIPRVSRND